jgi:hypothetical protein
MKRAQIVRTLMLAPLAFAVACGGSPITDAPAPRALPISPGARWSDPLVLSTPPVCIDEEIDFRGRLVTSTRGSGIALAAGAGGTALAAWAECAAAGTRTAGHTIEHGMHAAFFDGRAWAPPRRVGPAARLFSATAALDLAGDALLVWASIGTTYATFSSSRGWSAPAGLANLPPQAALPDGSGRMVAVGRLVGPTLQEPSPLAAARFDPASGWGKIAYLTARSGSTLLPVAVGFADHDAVLALWAQSPDDSCLLCHFELWSARFDREGEWSAPQRVHPAPDGPWYSLDLATNTAGDAVAVWSTRSGALMAARRRPGGAWGAGVVVHRPEREQPTWDPPLVGRARVAMNAEGDAIVVWTQERGRKVQATRLPAAGPPDAVTTLGEGNDRPVVVSDRDGNAVAVWRHWTQTDFASTATVYASVYRPGAGWGTAEVLGDGSGPEATHLGFPLPLLFEAALDGRGAVHVAWLALRADRWEVWTRRYAAD